MTTLNRTKRNTSNKRSSRFADYVCRLLKHLITVDISPVKIIDFLQLLSAVNAHQKLEKCWDCRRGDFLYTHFQEFSVHLAGNKSPDKIFSRITDDTFSATLESLLLWTIPFAGNRSILSFVVMQIIHDNWTNMMVAIVYHKRVLPLHFYCIPKSEKISFPDFIKMVAKMHSSQEMP